MIRFVRELTSSMHEALPGSIVIWYDSVLATDGSLTWQNALNKLNRGFFDVCDGIFLNYAWTPELLKSSVEEAGDARKLDVIAGIDIFGRGTFGGGGYTTHLAIEEITKHGCSVGLFAPGWTLEREYDCTQKRLRFEASDLRFWTGHVNDIDLFVNREVPWVVGENSDWTKLDEEKGIYEATQEADKSKTFNLSDLGFSYEYLNQCPFITMNESCKPRTPFGFTYYLNMTLIGKDKVLSEYSKILLCKESETKTFTFPYSSPSLSNIEWKHGVELADSAECSAIIGPSSLLIRNPRRFPAIASFIEEKIALPLRLPFITHFNQGVGKKFYVDEQLVSDNAWANMNLQDIQPTFWSPTQSADSKIVMNVCYDYAVEGGSSLSFTSVFNAPREDPTAVIRLFRTNIELQETLLFGVELAYLPLQDTLSDIGIFLKVRSELDGESSLFTVNCGCPPLLLEQESAIETMFVPVQTYSSTLKPWRRHHYQIDLSHSPTFKKKTDTEPYSFVIADIYVVCFLTKTTNSDQHNKTYNLRLGSLKILPLTTETEE
eukprot:TRINITY_DN1771_c0_g1_i3.p1 TRINITY_DN1771_c0_g1~~TRINITY_DN1771_c0_g1_i3.p1  ORF type:complete len:547 (+),score=51.10 TRINITY_DN1771_c0_g1_i3:708-2348(+)